MKGIKINKRLHKDKKLLVLVYVIYNKGFLENEFLALFNGINTFSTLEWNLKDIQLKSNYSTFRGQEEFGIGGKI